MERIQELLNFSFVFIDKPKGPTSHQISEEAKRILQIKKAGHPGTLDPAVTGVLPVALNKATRLNYFFNLLPKEYVGVAHLHQEVEEEKLKKEMKGFVGEIKQIPPLKSAVKRKERIKEIYSFALLEKEGRDFLFRVKCQAGTYIRKLISDLGKNLSGTHLVELRRTAVGQIRETDLITLQDLKDAFVLFQEEGKGDYLRKCLHPAEEVISFLPKIVVCDSFIGPLSHGRDLSASGLIKNDSFGQNQWVAVYSSQHKLICLGKTLVDSQKLRKKEEKELVVKVKRVFI